jgi:hypothetical protein
MVYFSHCRDMHSGWESSFEHRSLMDKEEVANIRVIAALAHVDMVIWMNGFFRS